MLDCKSEQYLRANLKMGVYKSYTKGILTLILAKKGGNRGKIRKNDALIKKPAIV